jgi:hypothetical protein
LSRESNIHSRITLRRTSGSGLIVISFRAAAARRQAL